MESWYATEVEIQTLTPGENTNGAGGTVHSDGKERRQVDLTLCFTQKSIPTELKYKHEKQI